MADVIIESCGMSLGWESNGFSFLAASVGSAWCRVSISLDDVQNVVALCTFFYRLAWQGISKP